MPIEGTSQPAVFDYQRLCPFRGPLPALHYHLSFVSGKCSRKSCK